MSVSNGCLIFTNLLTFIISVPILCSGLLIRFYGQTKCSNYVQGPVLAIGVILFAVPLIGMISSCCRLRAALGLYLCVIFGAVILLLCLSLLTATVLPIGGSRNDKTGEELPRLEEFPSLLREHLVDEHHWAGIKGCLAETSVCSGSQASWVWSKSLSPIKVGCCNPPPNCAYDLMNSSLWDLSRTSMLTNSEFEDCGRWQKEADALCFDCETCKAGFLERIRKEWMKITTIVNFLIAYLIINFLIACCAFTSGTAFPHTKQGDHC